MGNRLPTNVNDFRTLVCGEYIYVDKTLLMKQILDEKKKLLLFSLPQRFGKTTNMSMLQAFFEEGREDSPSLFQRFAIASCGEKYISHMGKHPVIRLNLEVARKEDWPSCAAALQGEIFYEYQRHGYEKEGRLWCQEKHSLRQLWQLLSRDSKKPVVLLIDGLDQWMEHGYFSGYDKEIAEAAGTLLYDIAEGEDALLFAFVCSGLAINRELAKQDLYPDPILSSRLATYFGFTQGEIEQFLHRCGGKKRRNELRSWFGGYMYHGIELWQTGGTIQYLADLMVESERVPRLYPQERDQIVESFIHQADPSVLLVIQKLIKGGTLWVQKRSQLSYEMLDLDWDYWWNFLLSLGYLKKTNEWFDGKVQHIALSIPNRSMRDRFRNVVSSASSARTAGKEIAAEKQKQGWFKRFFGY